MTSAISSAVSSAMSSFIAPVAPQTQPTPSASATPPGQPSGFAKLLSQRQAAAHDTARADKPKAPEEKASPDNPAAPQRAANSAQNRAPAKAEKPKAPPAQQQVRSDDAAATTAKADAASVDDETTDPALADWLSALNLPAPAEAAATPAATGAVAAGATTADAPTDAVAVKGDLAAGAGLPTTATDIAPGQPTQRNDAAADPAERLRAAHDKPEARHADTQAAGAWQAVAEQVAAPAEASSRQELAPVGVLNGAAQAAPATRPADTAAPVAVQVPTPAHSPEFPKALGLQVSVLMRDGVQQAELHLNPAEMGPISVQIALDGTQAQVNFGADSAATRQIIENGLPELAASLRDAGFTLSGGGVHSQARGRDEGGEAGNGQGNGRGNASGETEVTPRLVQTRVSAGGVDLYA